MKYALTILLFAVSNELFAYSFTEVCEGHTIYYSIIPDKGVYVTYGITFNGNYSGDVIIPTSVHDYPVIEIGFRAFYNCTGLSSIELPNTITAIGEYAFEGCSSLPNVELPNSVTTLGTRAFMNCTNMTNIVIPNSVNSIGGSAFYGCNNLKGIVIPNSVTDIGSDAFRNCTSLTNVVIPNSVTTIKQNTFSGCTNLTNVVIPNSVTTIESNAFSGCTSLTSVVIPNSVTKIENNAFSGCTSLTSIVIPNSVTKIEKDAFKGCTSLMNLSLDCTSIETWFKDFSSIKEIHLGSNVAEIKSSAFSGCTNLTCVDIPSSLVEIGSSAFSGCNSLSKVIIHDIKKWMDISFENWESNPLHIAHHLFSDEETEITNLVFPNTVTSIVADAFMDCIGLTSVKMPNTVTTIGNSAFSGCTNLTCVDIPSSLVEIGSSAFSDCNSLSKVIIHDIKKWMDISFENRESNPLHIAHHLFSDEETEITNLVFPNTVTSIVADAFMDCTALTYIELPNSVTEIGSSAFSGCTGLKSIKVGNAVQTIGEDAFSGCSSLSKVIVPDIATWCNITFGNAYSNPLYLAHYLYRDEDNEINSLTIPNSVSKIESKAFIGCKSLSNVIIPNSVTSIGSQAFYLCDYIETVYSLVTKVFTIDSNTFSEIVFNNADLFIPKGRLVTYQGTNSWSKFLNIHEGVPTEIGDLDRSYKLKVSDAGMATMYLDYPVAIPDNDDMLGVFYVSSMSDHILKLKRLKETIPANCGVIVMANTGTFTFKETLMSTDVVEENLLTGTTKKVNVVDIPGDVYTLGHGKRTGYMGFFKYTGATMPANKAYLVLNVDEEEDDVLVIDRDSYADIFNTTSIYFAVDEEDAPVIYDLQGRRVENPSKGIYIVNGKKVYIK